MVVDNYSEKKKNKQIQLEFAESGNIAVLERRFDEVTGVPTLKATQETNSKHLSDLIDDNAVNLAKYTETDTNLKALLADVQAKEDEREALEVKK